MATRGLLACLIVGIWATSLAGFPQCTARDRIKALLTGRVSEGSLIQAYFLAEPSVVPIIVPSRDVPGGLAGLRRMVRLYFPRTSEAVAEQNFFIFDGTDMSGFDSRQQAQMRSAMMNGSGGLNSRSIISAEFFPLWVASLVQEAFPNDAPAVANVQHHHRTVPTARIVLDEKLPPVLTMFLDKPVQWILVDYSCGLVLPRPGSTIWSWIKGVYPEYSIGMQQATPHLISWTYGKGLTWTCHDRLVNWWQDTVANPFGLDMVLNMMFMSVGWDLPEDIDQLLTVRHALMEYRTRMIFLVATIEFAELFGANMQPVERALTVIGESKNEAVRRYIEQDYVTSAEEIFRAIEKIEKLNDEAMKRKERAMVWVFVVQWLVVGSTAMICGFLLWTLMVRRRLYREVETTRPYLRRRA